jgi:hypothetical protein
MTTTTRKGYGTCGACGRTGHRMVGGKHGALCACATACEKRQRRNLPEVTTGTFVLPPDLAADLARARERWQELAEAGTPYWCTHDYSVADPAAYVWGDHPDDPIYRKHGVRCSECGGYIQEG